jgi:flagellar hook-associated protein 3 FlgL
MRITQRTVVMNSLQGLNRNLAAVNKLQMQQSSGKVINTPSDSPTGANKAMLARQDIGATAQQARNISDGVGLLDATDTALQNAMDQMQRVRDLTVQGSNGGALSAAAKQAISTELSGLRESLLGLANTTVQGVPIFGGVTTGTQAYDPATGAYVGVGDGVGAVPGDVNRRVSDSTVIRVNITGPEVFGDPAGTDVFKLVGQIAGDVTGNPGGLAADLTALDDAMNRMRTAVADIGTRQARLETAATVNSDRALSLQSQLSDVEDVDLPKIIMELQMQQTGYQAALGATAKAIQPSLLDFLR